MKLCIGSTLNRTIVGWKRVPLRTSKAARPALNRTIVGWKRLGDIITTTANICFKSHHSGMETELNPAVPDTWADRPALNRTIVGWKRWWPWSTGGGLRRFKSHHSGMETMGSFRSRWCASFFKSHHSGMETWVRPEPLPSGPRPLNRTIVGWKRFIFLTARLTALTALNRTIVGWKLSRMLLRMWRRISLNRTIVGWKLHRLAQLYDTLRL